MNSSKALSLFSQVSKRMHFKTFTNNFPLLSGDCQIMKVSSMSGFSMYQESLCGMRTAYSPCISKRFYAVKKGSKSKSNAPVSLTLLRDLVDADAMTKGMEDAIETMKTEFVKHLSLRSAGSLETLIVKYEGKEYELQQVAKISRKGQQTIVIDMLSFPQMTKSVVDTLKLSALNLNPQQENTTIYVPIPKVTKEHREILAKKAKALFITCRDSIKKIQEQNTKELRGCDIADSEKQAAFKQVKALGDKYVSQAESLMKAKQEELVGK